MSGDPQELWCTEMWQLFAGPTCTPLLAPQDDIRQEVGPYRKSCLQEVSHDLGYIFHDSKTEHPSQKKCAQGRQLSFVPFLVLRALCCWRTAVGSR